MQIGDKFHKCSCRSAVEKPQEHSNMPLAVQPKLSGRQFTAGNPPRINLIEWSEPADSSAPYAHLNHPGIARIALHTTNPTADVSLLEKSGIEFFAQPMKPEGKLGFLRFACFKEAGGVVLELVQCDFFQMKGGKGESNSTQSTTSPNWYSQYFLEAKLFS
jgi:hypothetical protein